MLHTFSASLIDKLYHYCRLEEAKKPIYVYGLELFLSTSSSIVSILILSACFSIFPSAILFLIFFCSLRSYVGGYHAKTYGRCFVLTNCVYFSVIGCTYSMDKQLPISLIVPVCCVIAVASLTVMFLFAPIKNRNHPLSAERYRHNRNIARTLVSISVPILAVLFFSLDLYYFILISFTLAAVAVMMIIPKLQERRT